MLAKVLDRQAEDNGYQLLLVCSSHGKVVLPWIMEETHTNGIPAEAVQQLVRAASYVHAMLPALNGLRALL